jgi:hypothetical protein
MIAERAPGSGITPGKGTLTDDLEDEVDTEEDGDVVIDEMVTQPVVKRSVFDTPFASDVVTEDAVDPTDEAPTTKRRG